MSATPTSAINYVEAALQSVKLALKSAGDNGTVDFLHFCDMAKDNLENAWNNSYKGVTAKEQYNFMVDFAERNNCTISLNGSCGLGRDCVGLLTKDNTYPDYQWYDDDYDDISDNDDIFIPDDAYHKHPCVAVLGHGVKAEKQLYEWLKWFDDNNYSVQCIDIGIPPAEASGIIRALWVSTVYRMVKNNA